MTLAQRRLLLAAKDAAITLKEVLDLQGIPLLDSPPFMELMSAIKEVEREG